MRAWEQICSGKRGFGFPASGVPSSAPSRAGKLPVHHLIYFLKILLLPQYVSKVGLELLYPLASTSWVLRSKV